MKKFLTVILWFSCLPFMYADSQGMQNTEIAGVKNGELREAVASWWGFNSGDATECLQKAIDSGVKKLIVDNTGREWLVGPIRLRSGQEIVFADGVVVRALPGAFKKQGESLFTAKDVSGVTLRGGKNAVLMMNKKDYCLIKQKFCWIHMLRLLQDRKSGDIKEPERIMQEL